MEFDLPVSELAFWNIDMSNVVEAGEYVLWVAENSQSGKGVSFYVVD